LLVNLRREVMLSHFLFKTKVNVIKFDPSGRFFAVGTGRKIQIWKAPPKYMEFSPFQLLRTITGHFDDITALDWSTDSRYLLTGSRDSTCRIVGVGHKFVPVVLTAHKEPIVNCFWSKTRNMIYTVSSGGAIYVWKWSLKESLKQQSKDENPTTSQYSTIDGFWKLEFQHFMTQPRQFRITSCELEKTHDFLVLGYSHGVFALHTMPEFSEVHSLSITQHPIGAAVISPSGEWLAFASQQLGQLLVWEWQSETCT
jgi:periodic tryptophan protein 2